MSQQRDLCIEDKRSYLEVQNNLDSRDTRPQFVHECKSVVLIPAVFTQGLRGQTWHQLQSSKGKEEVDRQEQQTGSL